MGSAFSNRGFQYHQAGLNSVGNYQMSGIPALSGNIDVPAVNAGSGQGKQLSFPTVTKRITVRNDGSNVIRFGFSATAMSGAAGSTGHRITLPSSGSFTEEFRVTDIWLISDDTSTGKASVIASLTGIPRNSLKNNWSGSAEVDSWLK